MAMSTSALVGSSGQSNNPLLANSGPLPPSLDPSVTQMAGHAVMEDRPTAVVPIDGVPQQETVKLSLIIERAIQTAYHELMVLTELLPRKPDVERKVELCKWCVRTRQMLVRVLALAKWAAGASRVDGSAQMTHFLHTQASYFVMTADRLHIMANEDLANAKLPTFYIPHAVDVLSTGSYPRLPCAIREKVVAPQQATKEEKIATLNKLNRIIPSVLVDNDFPKEFSNYTVSDGRVTFTVENEFSVTLTLFGVETSLPWRLLDIRFLIADDAVGEGRPLVHELQKNYLIATIQTKLNSKEYQLADVYSFLHKFCQSLTLEVVHAQVLCLSLEQRNPYIGVESYKVGRELRIFYWKDQKRQLARPAIAVGTTASSTEKDRETENLYSVLIKLEETTGSFAVTHTPHMGENANADEKTSELHENSLFIQPERLKVSELISKTIFIRSQTALKVALEFLQKHSPTYPATYNPDEPSISLQVLEPQPLDQSETIKLTIQSKTGMFVVSCPKLSTQTCAELETAINKEMPAYKQKLEAIRKKFLLDRVNNSLYGLTCNVVETPNFKYTTSLTYSSLPETKIFLQIENNAKYFVIICIESKMGFIQPSYYLLQLFGPKPGPNWTPGGAQNNAKNETSFTITVASLLPLAPEKCSMLQKTNFPSNRKESEDFECLHQPVKSKKRDNAEKHNFSTVSSSSESRSCDQSETKESSLTLPGLRDVVSSCYLRFLANHVKDAIKICIPGAHFFSTLSSGAPCVIITKMPDYSLGSVSQHSQAEFKKCIKSIEIRPRVNRNFRSVLGVTFVTSCPYSGHMKSARSGSCRLTHLESFLEINRWHSISYFGVPVNKIVIQWKYMLKLFDEFTTVRNYIEGFSKGFNADKPWLEIVSYDMEKLVLAYGPKQRFTLTLTANFLEKGCLNSPPCPDMPKSKVQLGTRHFASSSDTNEVTNPYIGANFEILATHEYWKPEVQLLDLLYSMHVTCRPMSLICNLDRQIKVGISVSGNKPSDFGHSSISIVTHSFTKLTLFYRITLSVDIEFFKDHVLLSDGALSRFSEEAPKAPTLKMNTNYPFAPQSLENFHWFVSKVLAKKQPQTTNASNSFSQSMVAMGNETMSPDPFHALSVETPTSMAMSSIVNHEFPTFNDMATTPVAMPTVVPSDEHDSSLNSNAMTPNLTVPLPSTKAQYETPDLDCKLDESMDCSFLDLNSTSSNGENRLPNSCFSVSYKSFLKLVEKRVQYQDANKTRLSALELYLAWTFVKNDLMNLIENVISSENHSLKLMGPNGLVTVLGIRDDFMGIYMHFQPQQQQQPDLNGSNSSDDITVIEDQSTQSTAATVSKGPLLSEADQTFLKSYFQYQIAVLPFRAPLFLAWCNFLLLPSAVVADFVSILQFETNPVPDHQWFLKVTWAFPMQQISNVATSKIGGTCIRRGDGGSSVMFLFVFTSKKSSRKMELPLAYNWLQQTVTPAIPNSAFDQFINEATQSISSSQGQSANKGNIQSSFLSTCIEYILVKMAENMNSV
ncbi:mediator of RNA polymerase II transcription subunit 14-like isoform X2 [Convolutriloba macropyga]|uniref:mediator of RNA polymerase II transcription subunit 14-like isoform X2 n=1 Tax=Convolutriloba macropyga TaxID=536237 RepID=UPI003F523193